MCPPLHQPRSYAYPPLRKSENNGPSWGCKTNGKTLYIVPCKDNTPPDEVTSWLLDNRVQSFKAYRCVYEVIDLGETFPKLPCTLFVVFAPLVYEEIGSEKINRGCIYCMLRVTVFSTDSLSCPSSDTAVVVLPAALELCQEEGREEVRPAPCRVRLAKLIKHVPHKSKRRALLQCVRSVPQRLHSHSIQRAA